MSNNVRSNWIKRGWRKTWSAIAKRALSIAGFRPADPELAAFLGLSPAAGGIAVDEYVALNYSAVWQALNILSGPIAGAPAVVSEQNDDGSLTALPNDRGNELFNVSPNSHMTAVVMRETLQGHALSWGNGYGWIDWQGSTPGAIWPIMPDQLYPYFNDDGDLIYRFLARYPGEIDEEYTASEILHIPGLGFNGRWGYSVIQMARDSLSLGLAAERYGASFFGNGALPQGVLEHPGELSKEAADRLRNDFEKYHKGMLNWNRIAVLEEGTTFKPTMIPPEDAQFLQTRQFQIVEVARWFNVPPHMLRDLSKATYSNIEQQGLDFLIYSLRPWFIKWEQEIKRKLYSKKRGVVVTFDPSYLLMADIKTRFEAFNIARNGGWYTLNDILRRERMPTEKEVWGDERLVASTMQPLGKEALRNPNAGNQVADAVNGALASGTVPDDLARWLLKRCYGHLSESQITSFLDLMKRSPQ